MRALFACGLGARAPLALAIWALGFWTWLPVRRDSIAADWPCLGRDTTRNPVSPEQNPPTDWDVATGRNINWKAEISSAAFGAPVIADGLVWIGGSRWRPGKEKESDDAAMLYCLDEQ